MDPRKEWVKPTTMGASGLEDRSLQTSIRGQWRSRANVEFKSASHQSLINDVTEKIVSRVTHTHNTHPGY